MWGFAILAFVALGAGVVLRVVRAFAGSRPFLPFPPGKSCAIAITDDTDVFQFETVDPVYELLDELSLRVTKTVWAFDVDDYPPSKRGLSLDDVAYREWVLREARRGHEIALHCAACRSSRRERTLAAHDRLESFMGRKARVFIFHAGNREAFYWGATRIPNRLLRVLYRRFRTWRFEGEDEASPYHWVDAARDHVTYVRGYCMNATDTLALNPSMPYEDPLTPGAPLWFACGNGRTGREFLTLLAPGKVARLKSKRGVSIVATHLAVGYTETTGRGETVLTDDVRRALVRLGRDPEIEFVPAGEVLDRLRVIQFLEDAIARSERSVTVPEDLAPALDSISVDPAHVPPGLRGGGAGRVTLTEWARSSGFEIQSGGAGVFDGARAISSRERWRLVVRWLATQVVTPTSGK